jgi:hypothetical protein
MKSLFSVILVSLAMTLGVTAHAQQKAAPQSGDANMQILRDKIKADKKLVVAANMQLTDAEAKAFWPIYEAYQKDLDALNKRLGKTIMAYAEAYNKGAVPNETAKKLLTEALDIEAAEVKLKQSYVPKLEKAISAGKAARYIQIENKIRAIVKYELAAEIPLVN